MSGDQQECVEEAPPVRLDELPAHGVGEYRQRGHELARELVGILVESRGHVPDGLAESGGASEPDQRGGHLGRFRRPGRLTLLPRYERDHKLHAQGLTLAAQYLPLLVLGPAAGVLADRWDRRRLMIATDLFRACAAAVMLLGTAPGRYWVLYVALIAESGGGVLYSPAAQVRTPAIVGTGTLLSSANSLNAFSDGATRLIGGPLGGVLLTVYGIKWLICADALSYLLSAAAMFMTSRSDGERPDHKTTIGGVARDLIEGVHVLRHQPVTRALLPVTVIFLAANASLSAVLIPLGVQRLGGSEHTGLLLSGLGTGFLIGAPILRALLDRLQPRHLLTASLTATAAAYFLLFSSSSLTTALPAAVGIGMFGSMCEVIPLTAMQRVIPNAALGRVSSVFLTAEAAATLAGAV